MGFETDDPWRFFIARKSIGMQYGSETFVGKIKIRDG
jgi:hypothetical protein